MLATLLLATALATVAPADTLTPEESPADDTPTTTAASEPAPAVGAAPRFRGYIQMRGTWEYHEGVTFSLPRARLAAEGALPQHVSYKLLVELESTVEGVTATTALRDAYLRWTPGLVTVTAGQFKTPFDREYLVSITTLETPDYPTVVDSIAPRRDIGIELESKRRQKLTWNAGIFNGEGQNLGANRDSVTLLVTRAAVHPWPGVQVGAGGAWEGRLSQRYALEAGFEWRGALLRTEWLGQRRPGDTPDDGGWFVLAAYRIRPGLQLVARQEDFRRPALGADRRVGGTIVGANLDLPGGHNRFMLEYQAKRTGSPFVTRDIGLVQWQARF